MKFKFISHTADIKFQAFGKTLEEVFENSALALFDVFYNGKVKDRKKFKIKAKGRDFESLLYNFLEEFLFLFDSENFLPGKIKNLKIDKKRFEIACDVFGDEIKNYETNTHVKAITYNEMFVKQEKNKFTTQVVVDV